MSFSVGLPRTVCSFVYHFIAPEIMESVLTFHDNFCKFHVHAVRMHRWRMRFKDQAAICDWTQTKMKGNFKLGLPLGYAQVITQLLSYLATLDELRASRQRPIVNPFSWIFNAIYSENSCLISIPFLLIYIDSRTVKSFPPAESWLVTSNFRRAIRMLGGAYNSKQRHGEIFYVIKFW